MATETVKRCDITGKIREDVCTVRVTIEKVTYSKGVAKDSPDYEATVEVLCLEKDMCGEALERCKKFVTRGATPPTARAGQ
jgi:hypothetical protein